MVDRNRRSSHLRALLMLGISLSIVSTQMGSDVADGAQHLLGDEDGLALDFTDAAFYPTQGLWGSAYIRWTSAAEQMLSGESQGLAIDFTDASFVNSVGLNGSAYIKT